MPLAPIEIKIQSVALSREVTATVLKPLLYDAKKTYPLMIMNDGQDIADMRLVEILEDVWQRKLCREFLIIAPHAGDRLQEYGVAKYADYKNRGSKAGQHTKFVTEELLPVAKREFATIAFDEIIMAGFSLGGLSAFDVAWNNAHIFSKVGVCSGSFWWRSKDLNDGYTPADRIMHKVVRETQAKPNIKIWLQCGTLDEKDDRDNNGVIDSIDDTMDLIEELKQQGFAPENDLSYNECIGGRHTLETYGIMLPYFFQWAMKL